ncbi:UNVERIFIED_CONTAM: hypothetical protein HHA_266368 [Hammondia hammondi]|eukprot:XP_008888230.1 hypothetical protein HHA_266368 [Hammondia hammondi]
MLGLQSLLRPRKRGNRKQELSPLTSISESRSHASEANANAERRLDCGRKHSSSFWTPTVATRGRNQQTQQRPLKVRRRSQRRFVAAPSGRAENKKDKGDAGGGFAFPWRRVRLTLSQRDTREISRCFPPRIATEVPPRKQLASTRCAIQVSDSTHPSPGKTGTRGLCPDREFDPSSTGANRLPIRRFSSAENADFPLHRQGRPGATEVRELVSLYTSHDKSERYNKEPADRFGGAGRLPRYPTQGLSPRDFLGVSSFPASVRPLKIDEEMCGVSGKSAYEQTVPFVKVLVKVSRVEQGTSNKRKTHGAATRSGGGAAEGGAEAGKKKGRSKNRVNEKQKKELAGSVHRQCRSQGC